MGVYIPNIEMPRNCTECLEFKDDCEHYWDYYCTHESRPNNCPLIEIDLVRCGECKWCDDKGKGRALICTNPYIDMDIHPLDFCSYGERRSE